jgi:predicted Fe-Mo cluster-binding NifX family protein
MKVAITAKDNKGLKAKVDPKFGRSSYFAIVNLNDMKVDFVANSARDEASGAGVKAAQIVVDKGVEGLISGNIGPKAFNGLNNAGIKIYSTDKDTLEATIDAYNSGRIEELNSPTKGGHSGFKKR